MTQIEKLRSIANQAPMPPKGNAATDAVLHRWHEGEEPDAALVAEARQCMIQALPFHAYDKSWRITYCGIDETECFAIEGVQWD